MNKQPPLAHLPNEIQAFLLMPLLFMGGFIVSIVCLAMLPIFGVKEPFEFIQSLEAQTSNIPASLFVNGVAGAIGQFLLPALVLLYLTERPALPQLQLNKAPQVKFLGLALVIMILGAVVAVLLSEMNRQIVLPASLDFLDQKEVNSLTEKMLAWVNNPLHFIVMTLVIAALPAVAEEFFFRGMLQRKLSKTGIGPEGAILMASLIFSLIHMDFNNFIARWMMGVVLGYLYYWSGSLWVCIFAHFVNNFLVVLIAYLVNTGILGTDLNEMDTLPLYITLPAMALMGIFMYITYRVRNITPAYNDIQEDDNTTPE
jgi:membrane protease YdiL (CAAX protease family)